VVGVTALLVTLLVIACVASYAAIGGAVGARFYRWRLNACGKHEGTGRDRYGMQRCINDHAAPAMFAGALWPLLAPILAGVWSATRDPRAARMQAEIERLERDLNIGGDR
jgi:hypothetical protein